MDADHRAAAGLVSEVRPHRDLLEFYTSRAARPEFVCRLFDDTARSYDWISGAISFGTCKAYRKRVLRRAGLGPGMRLLDVATGTGLVAQAALELGILPAQIAGLDPSRGMLCENRKGRAIRLVQGLGESLPFAGESFDFVCMGYALRHVEDMALLFREFHRVLKPGGRVLILEIAQPASRFGSFIGRLYLSKFLSAFVRLLTWNRNAGTLLQFYWATIAECVPPETIVSALSSSGLSQVQQWRTGAVLRDYFAIKPSHGFVKARANSFP